MPPAVLFPGPSALVVLLIGSALACRERDAFRTVCASSVALIAVGSVVWVYDGMFLAAPTVPVLLVARWVAGPGVEVEWGALVLGWTVGMLPVLGWTVLALRVL
ncbi:hypothetical protein ADK60_13840 [Streptomyces sp. XY431]|uniref:hypothetical protein n=1 Tax=Streptomyces sp. XY431 TaxID=1415562 RepID=UPI0006AEFB93|nr:hypothetical protein [Streptomyces sp. XY431]KOV32510.1 hypothetical protein ADK60_13840 [Streptomyces sp. XY431]